MTFTQLFGSARFVAAPDDVFPIIHKSFRASGIRRATLTIIGFGGYLCRINGMPADDALLHPLYTDFEYRPNAPKNETTAHRIYADTADITDKLRDGDNQIDVTLGNGWYTGSSKLVPFGTRKLCFRIALETSGGPVEIVTDGSETYTRSALVDCVPTRSEAYDFTIPEGDLFPVLAAEAPVSDYFLSDCPRDTVIREITPALVREQDGIRVYDAGENLSGFPVLRAVRDDAADIRVEFSEELTPDGTLDAKHGFDQRLAFRTHKKGRILEPHFNFYGFRYFSVEGPAEPVAVRKIHADIPVTSSFESSDETLNWLYHTYLNTQLCNMHQGIPSDCPHAERRGYTGDGQLTCKAAMMTLDAKTFYEKWIRDISDCQDRKTGHVQYTAPYTRSWGGSGGWGCAIVTVPYTFYKEYGDASLMRELYPQMLRYLDFLADHSKRDLVITDLPEDFCNLGEWCTPDPMPSAGAPKTVLLPPPFVNTYFRIRSLELVREIGRILGEPEARDYASELRACRDAVACAYGDPLWGNYLGNNQGANAFALDAGCGDDRTRAHLIEHYRDFPFPDTGIFGTDIVPRLLFEYGDTETAVKFLTAAEPYGFGRWKNDGATALWEYWNTSRSHSHPMFGAVVAHLFTYLVGIRQPEGSAGYERVTIAPAMRPGPWQVSGHITTVRGKIAVSYQSEAGAHTIHTTIPDGVEATLCFHGTERSLPCGENTTVIRDAE